MGMWDQLGATNLRYAHASHALWRHLAMFLHGQLEGLDTASYTSG